MGLFTRKKYLGIHPLMKAKLWENLCQERKVPKNLCQERKVPKNLFPQEGLQQFHFFMFRWQHLLRLLGVFISKLTDQFTFLVLLWFENKYFFSRILNMLFAAFEIQKAFSSSMSFPESTFSNDGGLKKATSVF